MVAAGSLRQDAPNQLPSLISDTSSIIDELDTILGRLTTIGDRLHGSHPRSAEAKAQAPAPMPSVRLNLDRIQSLISDIHQELSRIESPI